MIWLALPNDFYMVWLASYTYLITILCNGLCGTFHHILNYVEMNYVTDIGIPGLYLIFPLLISMFSTIYHFIIYEWSHKQEHDESNCDIYIISLCSLLCLCWQCYVAAVLEVESTKVHQRLKSHLPYLVRMSSHTKTENHMQVCYEQSYFDPLVGKSPYCGDQIIFDSGCIGGDVVPPTSEKEVMGNQALESPALAHGPPTGRQTLLASSSGHLQ